MPLYEHVFIARQDAAQAQVDQLTEHLKGVIEQGGGKVTKTEYWGLRSLTYKIKKNRKGHYVLLNLDAPAPAVAEMERQLKLNEDVIRQLTIRVEELEEGPSAGMLAKQAKERRDAKWGRRDDEGGGYEPAEEGAAS
jgi:small subunit ribosomal protein S6